MSRLQIRLLGCFQATLDGQTLTGFVSDKGRALLAYLALEADRPHRREALVEMLWPNRPDSDGRANLRQSLHRLRQVIDDPGAGTPSLLISPHEVQFNCKSDCWLDVNEFSQRLVASQNHHPGGVQMCEECQENMLAALALYKGDLLAGFSLPDCPHYDWWLLAKIEEYHRQALFMLDQVILHFARRGEYSFATHYAQRGIELEPCDEYFHCQKMRALALSGNPVAAIHQYETCRQILAVEMGIEPSKKTKNLLKQIRMGNFARADDLDDDRRLAGPFN